MAARATRSASLAARLGTLSLSPDALLLLAADLAADLPEGHAEEVITRQTLRLQLATFHGETVATGPLGALSHDALGVIFDCLSDPLEPVVAVALSSTCKGLRTPLQAALKVLRQRHLQALQGAVWKLGQLAEEEWSLDDFFSAVQLNFQRESWVEDMEIETRAGHSLDAEDIASLAMIMRTHGLPVLQGLNLQGNGFGDVGIQRLSEGLVLGAAPSLLSLNLDGNNFGPVGAHALAASFGGMINLKLLSVGHNRIGDQGVAALAGPLRMLARLDVLQLTRCNFGDEGAASLFADLGTDDFKALKQVDLAFNNITKMGYAHVFLAIDGDMMPELEPDQWGFLISQSVEDMITEVNIKTAILRSKTRRLRANRLA